MNKLFLIVFMVLSFWSISSFGSGTKCIKVSGDGHVCGEVDEASFHGKYFDSCRKWAEKHRVDKAIMSLITHHGDTHCYNLYNRLEMGEFK